MPSVHNINDQRISKLNSFLRGEISAVETYSQAISHLGGDSSGTLRENLDCHSRRVAFLRDKIVESGGLPDETSGAWGSFAKLIERGAAIVGKQPVYNALEEGEDHGLKMYQEQSNDDEVISDIIDTHLLPAQERTHERMRRLKKIG